MADNVKTGIRLEAEGEKEFSESLEKATKSIDEYSESTEKATEKTGALDEALKNLAEQEETKKLKDDIATTGAEIVTGMANMANAAIKGVEAFVSAAKEAAEYADAIGKAAQNVGFSTDAYQEWDYVLSQSGSSMKAASTAFTTLAKAQQGATKTAGDDLARIGLSLEEIQNLRPEELFEAVITQLQKMDAGSERTYAATKLLGSGFAKQLGPVLDMTAEETAALRQQIHELGGVMSGEQIQNAAAYNDSLDNLHIKFNSLKNEILLEALPGLTKFQDKLLENGSVETFGELVGTVAEKVGDFTGFLADHGDAVIGTVEAVGAGFATWKAGTIVKEIVEDTRKLYSWLSMVGEVLGISGGAAAGGIAVAALGVATVADRISELTSIGEIGDGHELAEYADNVAYLEQKLQEAQAAVDNLALYGGDLTMAQDEVNLINIMLDNAKAELEAMQATKEAAAAAGPDPAEQAEQVAASAEAAAGAAQQLSETGETIRTESEGMLQTFSENAGEIVSDFAEGTDEMSQAAATAIQNTQTAMDQNMAILDANAEIWGEDMMRSLANGILNGANSYVVAAVDSVAGAIEARLGFSEPDIGPLADFHTFAPDMMQLFAQGIREGQGLLDAAIGDVFDLGPLIAAQNSGGTNLNYGGVNVTIYGAEGQSADELYEVFSQRLAQDVANREAVFSS